MEMVNHCHCVSVCMSARGRVGGGVGYVCLCICLCGREHIPTKGLKIVGICPCDILRLKACE